MKRIDGISGYRYTHSGQSHAHAYLFPHLDRAISAHFSQRPACRRRVFDLGCGNGSTAAHLSELGYEVVGVDPSEQGIQQANFQYPELSLHRGSAYEPLNRKFGRFPVVISLEVVEHVYAPRDYAATLFDLTEPDGLAIVSTPYHGYLKNLALAVTGKLDDHFTALWDHGHIKFWSIRTLSRVLSEAGFEEIRVHRIGRVPQLAKSMLMVAKRSS